MLFPVEKIVHSCEVTGVKAVEATPVAAGALAKTSDAVDLVFPLKQHVWQRKTCATSVVDITPVEAASVDVVAPVNQSGPLSGGHSTVILPEGDQSRCGTWRRCRRTFHIKLIGILAESKNCTSNNYQCCVSNHCTP